MRRRLRGDLRTLLLLPVTEHPSISSTVESGHDCALQAIDLVAYLKALWKASFFPFPEDNNEVCLVWLGRRLDAVSKSMLPRETCPSCGFEAKDWKNRLDAIERHLSSVLRSLLLEVDHRLFESPGRTTERNLGFF